MKTIVSVNDFNNELFIPGVENPNKGVYQNVCYCIKKYEPIYLQMVLGYGFYKDVCAGLIDPDNVTQAIKDLIDGCDYTFCGSLKMWEGLRKHTAQYIYYWYQRMEFTQTTVIGQVIPTAENAALTTAKFKMVQAYNDASKGYQSCQEYLTANSVLYPTYKRDETKPLRYMNPVL